VLFTIISLVSIAGSDSGMVVGKDTGREGAGIGTVIDFDMGRGAGIGKGVGIGTVIDSDIGKGVDLDMDIGKGAGKDTGREGAGIGTVIGFDMGRGAGIGKDGDEKLSRI